MGATKCGQARVHGITLIRTRRRSTKPTTPTGEGISDFFRQGVIRLPHGDPEARLIVRALTHELVTWPDGVTDDMVMMVWFAVRHALLSYRDPKKTRPRFARPTYLGHGRSMDDIFGRVLCATRESPVAAATDHT
jgi:hypothetical protein